MRRWYRLTTSPGPCLSDTRSAHTGLAASGGRKKSRKEARTACHGEGGEPSSIEVVRSYHNVASPSSDAVKMRAAAAGVTAVKMLARQTRSKRPR